MRKPIFILFIFVSCFLVSYGKGYARVSGPCVNCHTMHNSQDGTAMAIQLNSTFSGFETDATPNNTLLVSDCLGCHSSDSPDAYLSPMGAPVVYTIGAPPNFGFDDGTNRHGLAGGNFYWVRTDETKGHNVFLGEPDSKLTNAPGDVPTGPHATCNQAAACHRSLANSTGSQFGFSYSRQGCTKCHMIANDPPRGLHHLDDSGDPKIVNSAAQGWYRFLSGHQTGGGHGVAGIEDTDWQATYSSSDHNEYLGEAWNKTSVGGFGYIDENTMTAYCTGCHGVFHEQDTTSVGSSPWLRHPSDAVIPDSGEYASAFGASGGTGTYDPQVPVARVDISGGVSSDVTLGVDGDMVMCLSCHRPHGSPYPDMLRWDYDGMIVGSSGTDGCFQCHTNKN